MQVDVVIFGLHRAEQRYPYSPVESEQIASYGEQGAPYGRINCPFPAIGLVWLCTPFPVEFYDESLYILQFAMLRAQVSVASQGDIVPLYFHNPVKHIVPR